jgi:hypothetical protein
MANMQAAGDAMGLAYFCRHRSAPEGQDQTPAGEHARLPDQDQLPSRHGLGVFAFLTTQLSEMQDDITCALHLEEHGSSSPSVMIQVGLGWRASD